MQKKVLITGSTGFIGAHLCRAIENLSDWQLVAWARSLEKAKKLGIDNNHEVIEADLKESTESLVAKIPDNLAAVIHLGGIVHSHDAREFHRINFEGTKRLVRALKEKYKNTPLYFSFISSLAAAGPGQLVRVRNEDDKDTPVSAYGHSKLRAENWLEDNVPPSWKLQILRPPVVIGPGDPGMEEVFSLAKWPVVPIVGFGEQLLSFISVNDLVRATTLSLEQFLEGKYFVSHPETYSFKEIIQTIRNVSGQSGPPIFIHLPLFFLRILTSIFSFLTRKTRARKIKFFANNKLSKDKMNELRQRNWRCSGKKLESALGENFRYQDDLATACKFSRSLN